MSPAVQMEKTQDGKTQLSMVVYLVKMVAVLKVSDGATISPTTTNPSISGVKAERGSVPGKGEPRHRGPNWQWRRMR